MRPNWAVTQPARSLLVAPRALIDRHPSDAELFSNCVSLEDLAKVLADAVEE